MLFLVSPKKDPDVNKDKEQSPSAYHTTGGRPVHIYQPGANSQEIVPLFNNHFSVVYWPGDYTDHCIKFAILFMNLLIPLMN
jgi:Na+-translocating ferredoxin:NAD+ oxidoreductase RnfD subunit